jgi:DNA-binding XRE family transcriptional regulator
MTERTHDPGVHVSALRRLHGLTQEALAIRSGLRRTEIIEIEKGRNQCTSARVVGALAAGFALTMPQIEDLLKGALTPAQAFRARQAP